MRYVSKLFQPVITIPKGAKIKNTEITCKSQKLLLECGLVRPTGSGLFALLPLASRALDKLERLAGSCVEGAGAQRVSLPALTAARLWSASGRLDAAGPELMKVEDRHGKRFVLAPTHEEAISELLADVGPISYKQLPLTLYQITEQYRDELRPKHGLLRARQFRMLAAYSAHAEPAAARRAYSRLARAYGRLFARLELPVLRVEAPPGDMGGELSHEWQLPAAAGEGAAAVCPACALAAPAAAPRACARCGARTEARSTIEVGHTFLLGRRYSRPLRALCAPARGPPAPLYMGCYGIGTTRLLAAALEALSSESALRWPRRLAPYSVLLIPPKEGSREYGRARQCAQALGRALGQRGVDVLCDDRDSLTIGKRLLLADKVGYPYVVVCGKAAAESPARFELRAAGGEPRLLPGAELLDELAAAAGEAGDDWEDEGDEGEDEGDEGEDEGEKGEDEGDEGAVRERLKDI